MLLKDDHEEKRRKSIKRERRKVREKGGKEAPMQMENIKMYEKTEKSEKTGKQKKFEREELLRIKHLSVTFTQYDGWFSRKTLPVIRDLSLSVSRGEMVAVVGSSGSGKSLLAHAVMGVLPYNGKCGGDIYYKGEQLTSKRIKKLRGHEIVLVPQSVSYLDPLMKVGEQVAGGKERISLEKSRKALARYVALLGGTDINYVMQDSPMDVKERPQNVVTFVSFSELDTQTPDDTPHDHRGCRHRRSHAPDP